MEESIWLVFGVITLIVALGIIASVVSNNDEAKMEEIKDAVKKLEVECNFVCETTANNMLSIRADIPTGIILYTKEDLICARYGEEIACGRCGCPLEEYELNLANSSVAKKFREHTYNCFFERTKEGVRMECLG